MGNCVNTKLVPEPHNTGHLVKTVYPPGEDYTQHSKKPSKHHNHGQSHTNTGHHQQGKTDTKGRNTGERPRSDNYQDLLPPTRTTKKVAKYKAKFDQRVTAKYDIKALIGRGSFSRVVRVEHRITKQPYAIKMVDRLRGKEVCESELNVLRRVRHPNIIQLIEVFESRDKLYMVMELATGGELFDRIIAKGSFTERDATHVLYMVLDGIRYLHSLGITHRDLKPENLLYYHPGHDSKILITDFGLSAFRKSGDMYMTTTCGTPEYIAPEILMRKPYTCEVDLWAVGVITYILLSGTMPFDDENRSKLYRLILKAKFSYAGEHWKDVSPLAKDFMDKLLVIDVVQRMTAQQATKHPWVTTMAASSSNKNLHRTISKNLLERQSTRNSVKSAKSTKSNKSNKSAKSLRSEHRRVLPEEIEELHRDPELQAELSSLSGGH